MKIRLKLLTVYLGVTLIPLFFLGAVVFALTRQALIKVTLDNLNGDVSRIEVILKGLFNEDKAFINLLAHHAVVKDILEQREKGQLDAAQSSQNLSQLLADTQTTNPAIRHIMLLDPAGNIIVSTDTSGMGENHVNEEMIETARAEGYDVDDFFKDSDGITRLHLASSIIADGTLIGFMVSDHDPAISRALIEDQSGLGMSGEAILAERLENGDALMIFPTRFDQNAALTRKIQRDMADDPIILAFSGSGGVYDDAVDYRGVPVFAAARLLPELQLGLMVKIDRAEALMPLKDIAAGTLVVILLTAAYILLVTFSASKAITGPIVKLDQIAKEIAAGKLDTKLERAETDDEVGDLTRSFERILISLKLAMRKKPSGTPPSSDHSGPAA